MSTGMNAQEYSGKTLSNVHQNEHGELQKKGWRSLHTNVTGTSVITGLKTQKPFPYNTDKYDKWDYNWMFGTIYCFPPLLGSAVS